MERVHYTVGSGDETENLDPEARSGKGPHNLSLGERQIAFYHQSDRSI